MQASLHGNKRSRIPSEAFNAGESERSCERKAISQKGQYQHALSVIAWPGFLKIIFFEDKQFSGQLLNQAGKLKRKQSAKNVGNGKIAFLTKIINVNRMRG
jgi:hypothetical protein